MALEEGRGEGGRLIAVATRDFGKTFSQVRGRPEGVDASLALEEQGRHVRVLVHVALADLVQTLALVICGQVVRKAGVTLVESRSLRGVGVRRTVGDC